MRADLSGIREILWQPLFKTFHAEASIDIMGAHDRLQEMVLAIRVAPSDVPIDVTPAEEPVLTTAVPRSYVLRGTYRDALTSRTSTLSLTPRGHVQEPLAPDPPFPGVFLAMGHRGNPEDDAERFGNLERTKAAVDLVSALRFLEPRLQRLATIAVGGRSIIHGDIGLDRLLPLTLMGDGLRRLTSILLTIATSPGGVVLIDEVENGLHHSVLVHAWKAIAEIAARVDAQVFATTHSFECIREAHRAFAASPPEFRLHRLERVDDQILAITYDDESLAAALQADLEVR